MKMAKNVLEGYWFKKYDKGRANLTPPLDYRDYADLGLRPPDTVRTPHTLVFTDDQRGKTVSVALTWQNERGLIGGSARCGVLSRHAFTSKEEFSALRRVAL